MADTWSVRRRWRAPVRRRLSVSTTATTHGPASNMPSTSSNTPCFRPSFVDVDDIHELFGSQMQVHKRALHVQRCTDVGYDRRRLFGDMDMDNGEQPEFTVRVTLLSCLLES